MLVVSSKSNLGCEAGCGLTVSCSDHARIMLGSCSDRSRIVNDVSSVLDKFLGNFGESFCAAGAVFGEFNNDTCYSAHSVSCVTRINHEIHFSWQAQYLVSLDNDTCYSARCK